MSTACNDSNANLMQCPIKLLIKTCFNVSANNFNMLLNRREAVGKLILQIIKMRKRNKGA